MAESGDDWEFPPQKRMEQSTFTPLLAAQTLGISPKDYPEFLQTQFLLLGKNPNLQGISDSSNLVQTRRVKPL